LRIVSELGTAAIVYESADPPDCGVDPTDPSRTSETSAGARNRVVPYTTRP